MFLFTRLGIYNTDLLSIIRMEEEPMFFVEASAVKPATTLPKEPEYRLCVNAQSGAYHVGRYKNRGEAEHVILTIRRGLEAGDNWCDLAKARDEYWSLHPAPVSSKETKS